MDSRKYHLSQHTTPNLMADFLHLIGMAIQNSQAIPPQEEGKQVDKIFTGSADVIFTFHGYVRIIHDLVHGRPEQERFHVRGFMEEGTTTTPFDMTVLNNISRYQLAIEAIFRSGVKNASHVVDLFEQKLKQHHHYIRQHLDDMPEIKNWKWS